MYTFYFRQCFTVFLFFLDLCYFIFSQFYGLFCEWKFAGISSLYSPLWLTRFPVAKMSKAPSAEIVTWIQSWRFLLHMANHLFFTVRISMNHCNSILMHFFVWLFHTLQVLASQWLPNYHINMISSNTFTLGSLFF